MSYSFQAYSVIPYLCIFLRVPIVDQWIERYVHEDVESIPDFAQWVKDPTAWVADATWIQCC